MKRLRATLKFIIWLLIPLLFLGLVACSENAAYSQGVLSSQQSLIVQSSLNYQRVKDTLEGKDLSKCGINIFLARWEIHPYVNIAKLFFEYGYDVNVTDSNGNSLLMYACGLGGKKYLACDEFFDLFVAEGADINHVSLSGNTPIDTAAENGYIREFKKLLSLGAEVSEQTLLKALPEYERLDDYAQLGMAKDVLGRLEEAGKFLKYSELFQAALLGNNEQVISILPDADWSKLSKETFTACVAAFCEETAISAILSKFNSSEIHGKMLISAAFYDNLEAVKFLLENCIIEDNIVKGAAIHALEEGSINSARYLLSRSQLSQPDCEALFNKLARNGKIESMKCLVECGLAPPDMGGCLWQAANCDQTEFAIYLVEELGVDPNGNGAICCAASRGNLELVRWLAEHGATVVESISPLNSAVDGGYLEVVQYLHQTLGADINGITVYTDGSGSCALENAIYRGYFEILKYLVENGADLSTQVRVYDPKNVGVIREISLFELAEQQECQTITDYLLQWKEKT